MNTGTECFWWVPIRTHALLWLFNPSSFPSPSPWFSYKTYLWRALPARARVLKVNQILNYILAITRYSGKVFSWKSARLLRSANKYVDDANGKINRDSTLSNFLPFNWLTICIWVCNLHLPSIFSRSLDCIFISSWSHSNRVFLVQQFSFLCSGSLSSSAAPPLQHNGLKMKVPLLAFVWTFFFSNTNSNYNGCVWLGWALCCCWLTWACT